jgi:hypothetical protein
MRRSIRKWGQVDKVVDARLTRPTIYSSSDRLLLRLTAGGHSRISDNRTTFTTKC